MLASLRYWFRLLGEIRTVCMIANKCESMDRDSRSVSSLMPSTTPLPQLLNQSQRNNMWIP